MNYIERTVRSAPGLSQEQALDSLQSHPNFKRGTKIASIRRRGDRWVATLLLPKFAAEDEGGSEESESKPPKSEGSDDGGSEEPSEGGPAAGGPPAPGGEGKPGEGGPEGHKLSPQDETNHLLTEILHAIKGGPAGPGMGGPDDLGPAPDPMGGPPPHGGGLPPAGAPKPGAAGIGAKLKPGEIRNQPGAVPVGAPAFSHTNHPLASHIAKLAGHKRTISVSSPAGLTIKQAKAELDPVAQQFGYKVAQITYCGPHCSCKTPGSDKIHALLSSE